MLIDWLTLRHPLEAFGAHLSAKIRDNLGRISKISPAGEILWDKAYPDWDSIRSDSAGLFWQIQGGVNDDGSQGWFLVIGGSPASQLNQGVNVFGSLDLEHGANVLIETAAKALDCILPHWKQWQCRRLDVTANYDMGSSAQVKQALRLLLGTDAPRRKTNSDTKGGDTVYWNPTSDLRAAKAYHKGAHLRYQKGRGAIEADEETLRLADRLLRLELKLGSRWFRRLEKVWHQLTEKDLAAEHFDFFSSLIGGGDVEVSDMGKLLEELEKVAPTKGQALAAHRTWSLIKTIGYTQTKGSMPESTFMRHQALLKSAGLSSADLCAGVVVPFRRKSLVLGEPVLSWDELRLAA